MQENTLKIGDLVESKSSGGLGLVVERPDCSTNGHGVWVEWIEHPVFATSVGHPQHRQWVVDCSLRVVR